MINRIFLDLDGVVRDWIEGINKLFNTSFTEEEVTRWDYITERLMLTGMTEKAFWEALDEQFWTGLKFTKDAPELLDYLYSLEIPLFLLTSPTLNNAGWSQKWIRNNLPGFFHDKRYLIGPTKWVCATPDSLLIDDAEKNIIPWNKAGGIGLLWPKPWNYMNGIEDGLAYLKALIEFHNG